MLGILHLVGMLALPGVVATLCAWALAASGDRSLRRWREAREREAGGAVARGRLVVVGYLPDGGR